LFFSFFYISNIKIVIESAKVQIFVEKMTQIKTKKHHAQNEPVLFIVIYQNFLSSGLIDASNHTHSTTKSNVICLAVYELSDVERAI
jgi:hypothetical protein